MAIVFLILAFAVANLAESLTRKLLNTDAIKSNLVKIYEKTAGKSLINLIAKSVFLLVFLLFLPSVLNRLSTQGVSEVLYLK